MEKIYILGGNDSLLITRNLGEFITVPLDLTVNSDSQIHDFLCDLFCKSNGEEKMIVDLDSLNPALALTIILHMRLSPSSIGTAAFIPVLFVSDFSIQVFLSLGQCSQLFLTKGISFCNPNDVDNVVNEIQGLSIDNYNSKFMDRIQIKPDAYIGTHSMANQWGADVLNRIISKNDREVTDEIAEAKKKLYYKYVYINTVGIDGIINNIGNNGGRNNEQQIYAIGKKILLIDDEAHRGWKEVLKKWLFGASLDVVGNSVGTYNDIPQNIREKIHQHYYDLYLLDLRLLGQKEDDIFEPNDFSGMKILKEIKLENAGNQVIILTASNKAWNMKALLDAGADGYYIKESPEYKYPLSFSEANYMALFKAVKSCFEKSYLKGIFSEIKEIKKNLSNDDFGNSIRNQFDVAYYLISKAETEEQFAFAYVSLYLILEIVNKHFVTRDVNDKWMLPCGQYIMDWTYDVALNQYCNSGNIKVSDDLPEWLKLAGIIFQQWGLHNQNQLVKNIYFQIRKRNGFIHNDKTIIDDVNNHDIYNKDGFVALFKSIKIICSHL